MKIEIPAFKAMAKCNEYLDHGPISIDLGPDVVQVVRCKDCNHYHSEAPGCGYCSLYGTGAYDGDFCSFGERKKGG